MQLLLTFSITILDLRTRLLAFLEANAPLLATVPLAWESPVGFLWYGMPREKNTIVNLSGNKYSPRNNTTTSDSLRSLQ